MVYSSDGKYIIDPDTKELIGHGTFGNVYKLDDDKCFKIFKHHNIHKPDPIITLKELSLNNFYKIYDLLHDYNFEYVGYIMKYYERDNTDILQDKDYLLDSINNIYNGVIILTKNLYQINDLHIDNVIVNKEGITVIDIDNYKRFSSNNTYINIFRYTQLIRQLLYRYLTNYNLIDPAQGFKLIKDLVNGDYIDMKHFNETINNYKKPIDYFSKVIK